MHAVMQIRLLVVILVACSAACALVVDGATHKASRGKKFVRKTSSDEQQSDSNDVTQPRNIRLKSNKPVEVQGSFSADHFQKQFGSARSSNTNKARKSTGPVSSKTRETDIQRVLEKLGALTGTKRLRPALNAKQAYDSLSSQRYVNPIVSKYLTNFYRQQVAKRSPQFALFHPFMVSAKNQQPLSTLARGRLAQQPANSFGFPTQSVLPQQVAVASLPSNSGHSFIQASSHTFLDPNTPNANSLLNSNQDFEKRQLRDSVDTQSANGASTRQSQSGVALLLPQQLQQLSQQLGHARNRVVMVPLFGSNPYQVFGQQTYGPLPRALQGQGDGQLAIRPLAQLFTTPSPHNSNAFSGQIAPSATQLVNPFNNQPASDQSATYPTASNGLNDGSNHYSNNNFPTNVDSSLSSYHGNSESVSTYNNPARSLVSDVYFPKSFASVPNSNFQFNQQNIVGIGYENGVYPSATGGDKDSCSYVGGEVCSGRAEGLYSHPTSAACFVQCDSFGRGFGRNCAPGTSWRPLAPEPAPFNMCL